MSWLARFADRMLGGSSRDRAAAPLSNRRADGVVDIQAMRSVRTRPIGGVEPFRRFQRLEPSEEPQARTRSPQVPPMLGQILVGSLFLGQDGTSWSDRELGLVMKSLVRAGEWLEAEAVRFGVAMNLELLETCFVAEDSRADSETALVFLPEGDGTGVYDDQAEVRLVAAASRAAAQLGFHDMGDLADEVRRRTSADVMAWIVHPRSAGRSFVVPQAHSGIRGLNLAIGYAREANLPAPLVGPIAPCAATYAHELLHLFGATDKYARPLRSFPAGTVTRRDIMRLEHDGLSKLRIDPGTAEEIGWAKI